MKPNYLLIVREACAKRIATFACRTCATLLAALVVSVLSVGCGGRSASATDDTDSARINRLRQIDDSVMTFAPSTQRIIDEGIRTAPDSITAYEYRLREARFFSLSDSPERSKNCIDNILRFASEQRKQKLSRKQTLRLNSLVAGAYNCRAVYYHNFHRNKEQAIELYRSAYDLLANSDAKHNMPNVCANLADVYLNMDSISRSQQCLDEVEPYFRKRHDLTALHYCKTIRIGIATRTGNTAAAQRLIDSNDETENHPVQYSLANLRNIYLQRYYEKVGDYRRAYTLMNEISEYNDSLEHNHSNMRSAEIMARFTSDTLKLHHDLTIEHKNATIEKTQKQLLLSIAIVLLLMLLFALWIMQSKRKQMKAQMDIMNLRLNIVRNRISPHFVFNILNNKIVNAGRVDDTELLDLTRLIRTNLDMSRQPTVKLAEELDFVEKYIRVERFMLGDDFAWHINVAADVDREKVLVPSMFLQILTENAIIHGLKGWDGHKELTIEVHRELHTTVINVSDNGPGFSTFNGTFKKKTGLGIIAQTVAINNEHNKNKIRFEITNIEHDGNVCGCRATVRVPDGVKFL